MDVSKNDPPKFASLKSSSMQVSDPRPPKESCHLRGMIAFYKLLIVGIIQKRIAPR